MHPSMKGQLQIFGFRERERTKGAGGTPERECNDRRKKKVLGFSEEEGPYEPCRIVGFIHLPQEGFKNGVAE